MKLQQIQVITRHGARCPIYWTQQRFQHFPNLPQHEWDVNVHDFQISEVGVKYEVRLPDGSAPAFSTYDSCQVVPLKGGCKSGQLTNTGRKQQFQLGKKLAQRYKGLVSPAFKPSETYARSSYYERTLISALYFLSGFYESISETVPIETRHAENEDIFANKNRCSELNGWISHMLSSNSHTREVRKVEDYINRLMWKKEGTANCSLYEINDLIRCYQGHGFTVPDFFEHNAAMINKYEMDVMSTLLGKHSRDVQRLCIGSFLDTLTSRIKEATALGECSHRMLLYSAHDWTLVSLLLAFGVEVAAWPKFSSYLVVELYDGGLLRFLYNDEPLLLAGSEFIRVGAFIDLVSSVSSGVVEGKVRCHVT